MAVAPLEIRNCRANLAITPSLGFHFLSCEFQTTSQPKSPVEIRVATDEQDHLLAICFCTSCILNTHEGLR